MSELVEAPRRPARQDTFDLRQDMIPDSEVDESLIDNEYEDVMDYDSGGDEQHRSIIEEDDEDDDSSSQLSIPNESIDFDLVYSLRNFVATTEGQANVHKGDTLFLMDDSNSYWWLVRVLKTSDIGYIPAENIETPIERLARLNKHRNVDLASATPAEQEEDTEIIQSRVRAPPNARDPTRPMAAGDRRSVVFTGSSVYYYPPFVWGDPGRPLEETPPESEYEEDEGDYDAYEDTDRYDEDQGPLQGMEPDDGMSWEDDAITGARTQASSQSGLSSNASDQSAISKSNVAPLDPQQRVAQQSAVGLGLPSVIQKQTSRESLNNNGGLSPSGREFIDPAAAGETRKLSTTPTIAREDQIRSHDGSYDSAARTQRALSISSTASGASSSESANKRAREEAESDADNKRSKGKPTDRKLRKERSLGGDSGESSDRQSLEGAGKKKVGFLGGLFGRKKDKKDLRSGNSPIDADSGARSSAESGQTGSVGEHDNSSMRSAQRQQYGRTEETDTRDRRYPGYGPGSGQAPSANTQAYAPLSGGPPPSDSSQSSISNVSSNTLQPPSRGTRPGSLIISSATADGLGAIVPELSVLRVFAGDHLQSEATFKTVLINATTTTTGLVRQAMQRFRLPEGEDTADYYLTIKQVDGDEAILLPEEHPLQAFEQLAEQVSHIQSIKRSSMGSINSLASNLTVSIAKLGMNDFTDDSTVKLYLHRSLKGSDNESTPRESYDAAHELSPSNGSSDGKAGLLTVATGGANLASVSPERFSSPSARFAMQVFIYPEDLPDGMVFDPHTEAIVPRATLQHRSGSSATISPGVSQTQRRKVFVFPKNTTVAEVIEASLERFGIVEGVVEGGDEVEDKPAKRRSSSRVRYGLNVVYSDGQQRELQPSTKVLDAFTKPPLFKVVDRRSSEWRRRSVESAHLMGTNDDIQQDDPGFVLRRAVGTRSGGKPKHAGPLDELALRQLHRESASSDQTQSARSSISSQHTQKGAQSRGPEGMSVRPNRDNGVDITMDAGLFRSQRQGSNPPSYIFVHRATGETVDIRDAVTEEFDSPSASQRDPMRDLLDQATMQSTTMLASGLARILERVRSTKSTSLTRDSSARATATSPSVYSQVSQSRNGSSLGTPVQQGADAQQASDPPRSRSATPTGAARGSTASPTPALGPMASRALAAQNQTGSRSASPAAGTTTASQFRPGHQGGQPSIASVMSDFSAYTSGSEAGGATGNESSGGSGIRASDALRSLRTSANGARASPSPVPRPQRGGENSGDTAGITRMLAVIELGAALGKPPSRPEPSILDQTFLGTPIVLEDLHPRAREFVEPTVRELEDIGKRLDHFLQLTQSLGRA